jgi:hypothetical protein
VTRFSDVPYAISVYILQTRKDLEFPFRKVDLPKDSSEKCKKRVFQAVSMVEVIKPLENPRSTLRQIKSLLKDIRITFCLHADASYLYLWLWFFFTDEMAMFAGSTYYDMGHIMPLTS